MIVRSDVLGPSGARGVAVMCVAAVVLLLCFIAGAHAARAGVNIWTSHGPEGGSIGALAIDPITPTTLYAGTSGAVSKSTDASATWGTTGLGGRIFALAIDPLTPTTLYAGKASSIFARSNFAKSTDGGANWNLTLLPGGYVGALAIDPITPSTLYAITGGVFKSTDSGDNWTAINAGLPDVGTFTALAIDPTTPGTLYVGASYGVYKSTDAGGTWEVTRLTNVDVFALAIDPVTHNTLYAGTSGGGPGGSRNVYKSTDAGATWEATSPVSPSAASVVALALDPSIPGTLYAGTNGNGVVCVASSEASCGVFKTTDSGGTWSPVRTGLPLTFVNALAADSTTIPPSIYAGTAQGVFSIQEVTSVVGVGSAASCTDAALNAALTRGGLVTFNCGGPATIDISSGTGTKIIAADTMVDGGGLITLSGGNTVGVFRVNADSQIVTVPRA